MTLRRCCLLSIAITFFGCSSDETQGLGDTGSTPVDSGFAPDANINKDAAVAMDAAVQMDAAPQDANVAMDAAAPDADAPDAMVADAGNDMDAMVADAGSIPCTMDTECAPTGWCRETQTGGMECVPWAEEGDSCGGFTPAWAQTRCNPAGGLCHGANPLIADAPGVCSIAATAAELVNDPTTYDGHVVVVLSGYILEANTTCTPGAPCNIGNACAAEEFLADGMAGPGTIRLLDGAAAPHACVGNECDYLDNCPHTIDARHRVFGTFRDQTPPAIETTIVSQLL